MKSPFTEFIEWGKEIKQSKFASSFHFSDAMSYASDLIEKEKEYMLAFGQYVKQNGWVGCKIEDLYEDFHNQNI